MTIKSSFGSVNLDVNPQAHPSATVLEPETPFHILLLGDFSGRATTNWKPVEIDRDNFEEVLARVAPGFAGMRFRELKSVAPEVPKSERGPAPLSFTGSLAQGMSLSEAFSGADGGGVAGPSASPSFSRLASIFSRIFA